MSIKDRKDHRTRKQFKKDIKNRTKKEAYLMRLFQREMKCRGHDVTFRSNGTDNKGEIQKKVSCDADYKVTIDGVEMLLDIKNSPIHTKWTFKVHNLEYYVKTGAGMLVFWGTGYIDSDPSKIDKADAYFGIIESRDIKRMLEDYEHYEEYKFGNKVCIKVPSKDFANWCTPEKLQCLTGE